ncbi:carboxymethylenebutenolidase [Acidithrix ferrooxidans]|uniref:Carboxymethylenebutenolidase n=2 Tax=Acidimicrobiaceae TaxID=84994 RepID=A0A0D8HPL9_9ACTN|nr:carboxymethylenebutenolidase [Acidithrix ferrooxidans]
MPVRNDKIQINVKSTSMDAELFSDPSWDPSIKRPGVVLIHEIFGLNEDIRRIAGEIVAEGYVVLAVDLFSNQTKAICMARIFSKMLTSSTDHFAIDQLKQALTDLAKLEYVDEARLGAVGFCLGGSLALAWSTSDNRLRAIAPFYSFNPRPKEALSRACPIVGSFPASDVTAKSGRALEATLAQYEIAHDIKIYQGAKHSFFNSPSSKNYNAQATEDSWSRLLVFFAQHLASKTNE